LLHINTISHLDIAGGLHASGHGHEVRCEADQDITACCLSQTLHHIVSVQSYSIPHGMVLAAAVHDLFCMLMVKRAAPHLLWHSIPSGMKVLMLRMHAAH